MITNPTPDTDTSTHARAHTETQCCTATPAFEFVHRRYRFCLQRMQESMSDFQLQCHKLPKALRQYDAYNELRTRIDDFNETVPMLYRLASPAIKGRHWQRLAEVTGITFKSDVKTLTLKDLMLAGLLPFREQVEELCTTAGKEEEVQVFSVFLSAVRCDRHRYTLIGGCRSSYASCKSSGLSGRCSFQHTRAEATCCCRRSTWSPSSRSWKSRY